ncbi:Aminoglycoside phosphotransferase [Penicillium citrinum]|uniref:Aminoglycoside phosphotransferase n=1 Tax=Penicillium citrinum TaxID=5077 RepID=A0A9W9TFY3_PENCI|nr:Aminoglycoside phosphotransferase [Penicillium citrinum]KAJ5221417.1 Aminoglycoside phosphotransferase [Penicillium citrinum]
MEGGFSKSSSVLKVDRTEVIAKIPCRIGGPPSLTTAGDTQAFPSLEFFPGHQMGQILLAPSIEYIIMEKASGVPLFPNKSTMGQNDRLIKNLTKFETQLSAIQFPVYGGLYLRTDIRGFTRPLGNDIHLSKSFQIGLSCNSAFDLDMLGSSTEGLNLLSSFVSSIA